MYSFCARLANCYNSCFKFRLLQEIVRHPGGIQVCLIAYVSQKCMSGHDRFLRASRNCTYKNVLTVVKHLRSVILLLECLVYNAMPLHYDSEHLVSLPFRNLSSLPLHLSQKTSSSFFSVCTSTEPPAATLSRFLILCC